MEALWEFWRDVPTRFTEFEDQTVRKMIDKVTVIDAETIRVKFKGLELEIDKKLHG